jgi:hypothetical protein
MPPHVAPPDCSFDQSSPFFVHEMTFFKKIKIICPNTYGPMFLSCHLSYINRILTPILKEKSPYEILNNVLLDLQKN